MDDRQEKVGEYWGNFHANTKVKLSWLESKVVENFINKRISGNESQNWVTELKKIHSEPFQRALIVGCGAGQLDRDLIRENLFQVGLGVDIARTSLALAEKNAEIECLSNQLSYQFFDLEEGDYASLGEFDLVIIQMAAHHVSKLDFFFKNIRKILDKKRGIIALYEYIGPNRFWHSDNTVKIINQLLDSIGDEYKFNHLVSDGSLRKEYTRTSEEHFLKHDPSEAIRSEDIIRILKKYFSIIDIKSCGGQINHMLLTGITENLDKTKCGHQILKLLMTFEVILEEAKVIEPDFAIIFAKPKRFFISI